MILLKNMFFKFLIVFSFLTTFLRDADSARILGIFPFMGKSHFLMFEKIMKELVKRGHEVDVYSHFPQKTPVKGYQDTSLVGTIEILTGALDMDLMAGHATLLGGLEGMVGMCGTDLCTKILPSQQMATLKNSTKKYDLLLTEVFGTDCMLGWAWHFGIPSIGMTSSANMPWASDYYGFPDNPAYIPGYFVDVPPRMNLFQRVYSTYVTLISKLYHRLYSLEPSTKLAREFFGQDMPHLSVLARNSSLQLVNAHYSINHARPLTPNVIDVAGIQIEDPKPLNEHFSKLMELKPDQKGVIYFTLGSLIQTETLAHDMLQGMFNAFSRLPYKVLWKARKNKFSKNLTIPENVNFEWWMPQLDILCHPNTKLYISHGGNMGIQESTYCGVPILGLPLFGDQEMNIVQLEYLGTAIRKNFYQLTEEDLFSTAHKMLNEPKYHESAQRVSKIFKDRPMKPLDTAIYWIEYVLRHQGAPELRPVSTELYWYQYHLLDVLSVVVGVPLLLVGLAFYLLRKFVRKITGCGSVKSRKSGNKKKKAE